MQAQGWIAHERDVNGAGLLAGGLIEAVVILGEARAVADRWAQIHRVQKPVRTARPGAGEGVSFSAERRAQERAFVIPIAKITAEEKCEDGAGVIQRKVIGGTNARAGVEAAAARSVGAHGRIG